ncbi:sugar ABC transporter ATP-binding protein [Christensenella tenuis]|uniref:Sugar ABC transporter ATP-binding protein n=1 Tax=Christensenella tenuis TaxID=2763033 RepID=A0ABR7EHG4_9FIRM|nr:sugar ABC transporter ATP-binding protein [Christensenella tenuis]MBC5649212.1 sugar ABC transporter ATP-binding protein [Christensenella tenuis]
MDTTYRVQMEGIYKSYKGVHALTDVSFAVKPGEIHALVGENGAGKSTLMKVLSGAIAADKGSIKIDGVERNITSPRISRDLGISIIYQEFMLAPHLTVAENIYIDRLVGKNKLMINWKKLKKDSHDLLEKLGFSEIDPDEKVGNLSVAYQQVVEICKSLSRDARVLVLDEPSAVLTFTEIQKLFKLIRQLKEQGIAIVYISHRMDEIFDLCDTVTVLKDGHFVNEFRIDEIDKKSLIYQMVGRELSQLFPKRNAKIGETILKAEHLKAGRMVNDVSFNVHKGEVLGFSGLVGAGRTETMRSLFGADKLDSGSITYKGQKILFKDPHAAVRHGVGLLSEDRKQQGIVIERTIRENTTLTSLGKVSKFGIINHKKDKEFTRDILARLTTKYGDMEDSVSCLSGGNQQKVSLAKWLAADCEVIILDEPTRGVDVGAKAEIYKNINDLAEAGVAVIMVSSEMEEVINMCDRVVVMRQGKVVGELEKKDMNDKNIIGLSMGVM